MTNSQDDCSEHSERIAHRDLAAQVCNLRFDENVPLIAEVNTLSTITDEAYFAERLDCRTYFAERQRYGHDRPEGVFQGSDVEHLAYFQALCERLKVSPEEIARADVLREYAQAVQIDPESDEVIETTPKRELRAFVRAERQVKGIPVWSSHLTFGLTAKREIGFLEFHWPQIPDLVVREARRMTDMVCNGWRAPEQSVAAVESIQAGIVHTPAVGYFFDVHAAIRVIYRSLDPNIGRKPAYYFDRHGTPVKLRQTSELIRELPLSPRQRPSAPSSTHQGGRFAAL